MFTNLIFYIDFATTFINKGLSENSNIFEFPIHLNKIIITALKKGNLLN